MTGVLLLFFVVVLFNCLCLLMIEWWLPEILKLWLDEFFAPKKHNELNFVFYFFFFLYLGFILSQPLS